MTNEFLCDAVPAKPALTIKRAGCFAFLPDSEHLAVTTTGETRLARIVSLKSGADILQFPHLPVNMRRAAVSESGHHIAFGRMGRDIILCDTETGRIIHRLRVDNDGELYGLSFAPRSSILVHGTWRGLTLIDAVAGSIVGTLAAHAESGLLPSHYNQFGFSPSGDRLAVGWSARNGSGINPQYRVSVFAWPEGNEIDQIRCERDILQVVFSPDNRALLLKDWDGKVETVPLSSSEQFFQVPSLSNGGYFATLAFSPDGKTLAYGFGSALALWRWQGEELLGVWRLPGNNPLAFDTAFSPDGQWVAVALNRSVVLYRVSDMCHRTKMKL